MKYAKLMLLLLFICILGAIKVSAQQFVVDQKISNVYYKKVAKSGKGHYALAAIMKNKSNNHVVYCLDPFIKFGEGKEYNEFLSSNGSVLNYSLDLWKRLSSTIYFGYGYRGHEENLWYAITQVAIWRLVDENTDSYFTDSLNGNKTNIYDDKLNELNNLVNSYLNLNTNINKMVGADIPLELDKSFENEKIISQGLVKKDNYITINERPKDTKTYYTSIGSENNAKIYLLDGYQSLIELNDLPYTKRTFNLTNSKGNININLNIESDTYSNCKSNEKNRYYLMDENRKIIREFTIENKSAIINDLEYGTYYIKQFEHSCDTLQDKNLYIVNLDKSSIDISLKSLKNVKIIEIYKKYCTDDVCQNEANATFMLYDNNYEKMMVTNSLGFDSIEIGAGNYIFRQIKGKEGYYFINDIKINTNDYSNTIIKFDLYNKIKKYNLKVEVKDDKNIGLDSSKVCLYNKTDKLIECKTSNKDGIILFDNLIKDSYYIKQEEVDDKYELNKNIINIDLKDSLDIKILNKLKEYNNLEKKIDNSIDFEFEVQKPSSIVNLLVQSDNLAKESGTPEENMIKNDVIYDTYIDEVDYMLIIIICLVFVIIILKYYEKYYN